MEKIAALLALIIETLSGVLMIKFLSMNMDKNSYGNYLLMVSIFAIVMAISFSAVDQGFLRKIESYKKEAKLNIKFSGLIRAYIFFALGLILICTLINIYNNKFGLDEYLCLLIWIGVRSVTNLQIILVNGLRDRWVDVVSKIIENIAKFSTLIILNDLGELTIKNVLLSNSFSSLIQIIYIYFKHRKYYANVLAIDSIVAVKESFYFCWPMIIWGGFTWLQTMSARWIISERLDPSVVAEYYILYSVATMPINMFLNFVTSYIVPIIYQKQIDNEDQKKYLEKIALSFFAASILIGLSISIWAEELIIMMSSRDYSGNTNYVLYISFSVILSSSASLLAYYSFLGNKLKKLLLPSIIPGGVMVVTSAMLINKYGLLGVVVGLLFSHIAAAVLHIWVYKFSYK